MGLQVFYDQFFNLFDFLKLGYFLTGFAEEHLLISIKIFCIAVF